MCIYTSSQVHSSLYEGENNRGHTWTQSVCARESTQNQCKLDDYANNVSPLSKPLLVPKPSYRVLAAKRKHSLFSSCWFANVCYSKMGHCLCHCIITGTASHSLFLEKQKIRFLQWSVYQTLCQSSQQSSICGFNKKMLSTNSCSLIGQISLHLVVKKFAVPTNTHSYRHKHICID